MFWNCPHKIICQNSIKNREIFNSSRRNSNVFEISRKKLHAELKLIHLFWGLPAALYANLIRCCWRLLLCDIRPKQKMTAIKTTIDKPNVINFTRAPSSKQSPDSSTTLLLEESLSGKLLVEEVKKEKLSEYEFKWKYEAYYKN